MFNHNERNKRMSLIESKGVMYRRKVVGRKRNAKMMKLCFNLKHCLIKKLLLAMDRLTIPKPNNNANIYWYNYYMAQWTLGKHNFQWLLGALLLKSIKNTLKLLLIYWTVKKSEQNERLELMQIKSSDHSGVELDLGKLVAAHLKSLYTYICKVQL